MSRWTTAHLRKVMNEASVKTTRQMAYTLVTERRRLR